MTRFLARTIRLLSISTLAAFPLLTLPACGPNANKVNIEKPPGGDGGRGGRTDDKPRESEALPTLSDDDLRFIALEELIRVYRSSKILLTGREMPDQTLVL